MTDEIENPQEDEVKKELGVIKSMLAKLLGKSDVIKQFNDKTYEIIEPLYSPFGKVDGHLDTYKDKNGPFDLVKSFSAYKDTMQKAINHDHKTDCFDIVEAWVNEKATKFEDGTEVGELQPLVKLRYTEKAYKARKEGRLLGPSIGCSAWTESVVKSLSEEFKKTPKRFLSEFDFSQKRHHLSLTTKSVGGPASQENWFIDLNKAMKDPEDLALLEELGEEYTELEKKQAVYNQEKAPSTSATEAPDAGVDNETLNKGKEDTMSDISKAEFEALQKELAEMKAEKVKGEVEKSLTKYELDEEVQKGLAGVLVAVEDKEAVTKALDALVARVEAVKTEKEELAKAAEGKEVKEPTELEKAMAEEEGEMSEETLSKAEGLTDEVLKKYREMV